MEYPANTPRNHYKIKVEHLALAACCLSFFVLGALGVDFGRHWDEPKLLRSVEDAYQSQRLLPGWYQYPSLTFWIGLFTKYLTVMLENAGIWHLSFQLSWRLMMISVTSLTGVWTYLLAKRIYPHRGVGIIAAGFVLLSFELLYHSRWIAPDTLMMQFGVASTLVLHMGLSDLKTSSRRLWQAAFLAGCACSTKYPGGLFIVPILVTGWMYLPRTMNRWSRILDAGSVVLVFIVTVLLTTPGILLDFNQFVHDVLSELKHYRTGHSTYSIKPGLTHLKLNLQYILVCLTHINTLQYVAAIAMLWGYIKIIRSGVHTMVSIALVPTLYLVYFSNQRVMIVRNLLVLLPFASIFAGVGLHALIRRLPFNRWLWIGVGLLFACVHTAHNGQSVQSILASNHMRLKDKSGFKKRAKSDLNTLMEQNPQIRFTASTTLSKQNEFRNLVTPKSDNQETLVVFWSNQKPQPKWRTNQADRYLLVSGKNEVNWSYYPSWLGSPRLLAVSLKDAVQMKLVNISSPADP